MMDDQLLDSVSYILPALVTGFVAYYMFHGFLNQQNADKKLNIMADKKKESLPIKLQAYERMLLFCERINPVKMLVRIKPTSDDVNGYLQLLINSAPFHPIIIEGAFVFAEVTWGMMLASATQSRSVCFTRNCGVTGPPRRNVPTG